jgi:hypothetical protein
MPTMCHVWPDRCLGASTLIVDTGCYAAAAGIDDLVSYSVGLIRPRAEWQRRVL